MKYLLALLVLGMMAMIVWTGVDITPTTDPAPVPHGVHTAPETAGTPVPSRPTNPASVGSEPVIQPAVASARPGPGQPGLLIPVQGKTAADLSDTFSDARSEGRTHDAIDIMAGRGTPVVAVADGHVEKLFTSERGGLTIYQFEPTGRYAYYYAHLDRYVEGLAEKQTIHRGQVIGYVGSTGNASPEAPHLHFAIFLLGPERQWWKGSPVNPYPILTMR
jgi:murein DD-endopeptidase MepM/ murein hydrolase activator NlpD